MTTKESAVDWAEVARDLGSAFAARAVDVDVNDAFVSENYVELKARRVFSAPVQPRGRSLFGTTSAAHRLC